MKTAATTPESQGFTLVEMTVVMVIVGLMLGGLLLPLSGQMDQRNYSKAQADMNEIREALIGYGLANGHLPCPAISITDGREDRSAVTCTGNKRVGFLPWAELGVAKLDSWGHLYRYSVTPAYTNSGSKVALTNVGDITIRSRDSAGASIKLTNEPGVPVAIVSFGKNGRHGFNNDGSQVTDGSATNTDEDSNANGTTEFFSRDYSETTTGGGEFDDVVVWISPNVYINRMVTAGQLP